jgi:tRNA threonylcarbamoyl adenosine modification protein YeaZ
MFLGIETTTDNFLLVVGTEDKVAAEKKLIGKKHSELLVPAIEEILEKTGITPDDLTAIGVGVGPGSFTGIRVGMSCAITIAQLQKIPAYGISFMDISGKKNKHPVIKAFRDKYYHAEYDAKGNRISDYKIIIEPEKEKLGAVDVDINAEDFLKEIGRLHKSSAEGNWKNIEPIYVMETVYKPKKKIL